MIFFSCCFFLKFCNKLFYRFFGAVFVLCIFVFVTPIKAQNKLLIRDKTTHWWYEALKLPQDPTFHSAIYPRTEQAIQDYDSLVAIHFQDTSWSLGLKKGAVSCWLSPVLQTELNIVNESVPYQHQFKFGLKTEFQFKERLHLAIWAYAPGNNFLSLENKYLKQSALSESKMWLPYNAHIKQNEQIGGYLSYQAFSFLNFQVGKGRHFWGDGYRSLLLSDSGASYPYVRFNVGAGRLNYTMLYQFLKDYNSEQPFSGFQDKYAASHFLSWNISSRFNLSLFESVVWQGVTTSGKQRGFDWNYMHPFLFFRPVEFSIGSPDNVIMGAGFRFRLFKNTHLYGQMVLDEFKLNEILGSNNWWANKYGFLLGVKVYDFLNVKNLFVLAEYNTVRPFTYSHWSSMENYGHLKQPLAHPLGANFKEGNLLVDYQLKRWVFDLRMTYFIKGLDMDSINEGGNIYRSYNDNKKGDYGHITTQGYKDHHLETEMKVGYVLNRSWHLKAELGYRIGQPIYSDRRMYVNMFFVGLNTLF